MSIDYFLGTAKLSCHKVRDVSRTGAVFHILVEELDAVPPGAVTESIVNNTPIPELNCDPNIGRAERRSLAQLRFELQESGLVASANSQEVLFSEPTGLARYPSSCQPAR